MQKQVAQDESEVNQRGIYFSWVRRQEGYLEIIREGAGLNHSLVEKRVVGFSKQDVVPH